METSIVTPDNSKILTVKLRRETFRLSYSTDNRSKCKNESAYLVSDYTLSNYVNIFFEKVRFHIA